jgi:hypothetical protein
MANTVTAKLPSSPPRRAAWLDHGIVRLVGPTREVVEAYARAR